MSTTKRRDMLGKLAFASAVGAVAGSGLVHGAAHLDAELLQAGRRWHEAGRIWLQDPDEDVSNNAHEEFERLSARIEALPAQTMAGVAVRLRATLLHEGISGAAEDFLLCGGPPSEGMFDTDQQQLLWSVIQDVDRIAAGRA